MTKPSSELLNKDQLFMQLSEGNERAFENIYKHYSPRLIAFVDRMVRIPELTEEIIQDVFIQLWTRKELLVEIKNPSAYLYSIASNKTIDYQRKISMHKQLLDQVTYNSADFSNETEEQIMFNESAELLKKAISQLPDQRKLIYELSRTEGLSHQQIAERLNISKSTVANQMVTALKQIRVFMEGRGNLFSYAIFFLLTRNQ